MKMQHITPGDLVDHALMPGIPGMQMPGLLGVVAPPSHSLVTDEIKDATTV